MHSAPCRGLTLSEEILDQRGQEHLAWVAGRYMGNLKHASSSST